MTDLRKAAEMALEALELFCECGTMDRPIERREALRQVIKQAEKQKCPWPVGECTTCRKAEKSEPVAYVTIEPALDGDWRKCPSIKWVDKPIAGSLYTAPPKREWFGLTEDDIHDAFNYVEMVKLLDFDRDRPEWCEAFARACEARLRHRNGENQ